MPTLHFDNFIYDGFLTSFIMMIGIDEKIAGEIIMAENPGKRIRKWRDIFRITQTELAENMNISSSVISDYEKGRRSPGSGFVRDIVETLIKIDQTRGGKVVKRFTPPGQEGIIGLGEFAEPLQIDDLTGIIDGQTLRTSSTERNIFGYTIIDSLKAVMSMKSFDYLRIYGWSTERALFFTGIRHGRSPMVAIRASPLTPAVVCYVQPEEIDELTLKLAEIEGISMLRTDLDVEELTERLSKV